MDLAIVVVAVLVVVAAVLVATGAFSWSGRRAAARWPSGTGWLADNLHWQGGAPRVAVPAVVTLGAFVVLGLAAYVLTVL